MTNKWVEHVRQKARELGLTYGCAVSDPRVKSSYVPVAKKKTKTPQQEQRIAELVQLHYKRKEEKRQQEEAQKRQQEKEQQKEIASKVYSHVLETLEKEGDALRAKVLKRKLYDEEDYDRRTDYYYEEDYYGEIGTTAKEDLWKRVKSLYKKYGISKDEYDEDFHEYVREVIRSRVYQDILDENR